MRILGIETSCDETAAAVVEDRTRVLSNSVASQVDVHRLYGGVVPELASRCHIEMIDPIVRGALEEAGCDLSGIDAIAVTQGPGLAGSLLVGLSFAKAVAFARDLPLVGVNHLDGHIRAAFIEDPAIPYPSVALVVSGGHTALYLLPEEGTYRLLAKTRDDAAGEAYDKVAKLLGLGYPGGPIIDRLAPAGDDQRFLFPLPRMSDHSLDFSFSGLKTAALRFAQAEGLAGGWRKHREVAGEEGEGAEQAAVAAAAEQAGAVLTAAAAVAGPAAAEEAGAAEPLAAAAPAAASPVAAGAAERGTAGKIVRSIRGSPHGRQTLSEASPPQGAASSASDGNIAQIVRDLCASFQRAAVRLLIERTMRAADEQRVRAVILSGGVACNSRLRADLAEACVERGISLHLPPPRYCTDNAAMIAAAGFVRLERGETADLSLNADPSLRLGGPESQRRTLRHK